MPLLDNKRALAVLNIAESSKEHNNFGSVALAPRDQKQNKANGQQHFNLILCEGNAFFIEMSSKPIFIVQGGVTDTPTTIGYQDPVNHYPNQLFILDGPYIRL